MNDLRVKLVARRVRYLRVQSALPIYEKHCFPLSACRRDIDLAGDARVGAAVAAFAADDRFTLLPVPCLGACDRAPAMMIDEDLHGPIDVEKVGEILAKYA